MQLDDMKAVVDQCGVRQGLIHGRGIVRGRISCHEETRLFNAIVGSAGSKIATLLELIVDLVCNM